MPTEVKIRKVRSVTVSGVQRGAIDDGKYARVLTVRSEDGHIYNITLVGERAEWLELEQSGGTPRRARSHGDGNKHSRGGQAAGLNSRKKFAVVAAARSSSGMPFSRATSSAT